MPSAEQIAAAFERMLARCEPFDDGHGLRFSGAADSSGYGVVRVSEIVMSAHRLAYVARHGEIPAGHVVMHSCDRPLCVDDPCLRLGTQADNLADCIAKGRARRNPLRGEAQPTAKLTTTEVQEIRAIAGCVPNAAIAREYGVSQSLIRRIIRGEAWAHVPDEKEESVNA